MILDAKYKPWMCCADKLVRFELTTVYLQATGKDGEGTLTAADGFIALVVPVKIEPDDVLGMIGREAFEWAMKITPPKKDKFDAGTLQFAVCDDHIRLTNGVTWPNTTKPLKNYPDISGLFTTALKWPALIADRVQDTDPMIFDQKLLAKVCLGLGNNHVILTQLGITGPILVEAMNARYPKPPYALMMPMHYGERDKVRTRFPKPEANGNGHHPAPTAPNGDRISAEPSDAVGGERATVGASSSDIGTE